MGPPPPIDNDENDASPLLSHDVGSSSSTATLHLSSKGRKKRGQPSSKPQQQKQQQQQLQGNSSAGPLPTQQPATVPQSQIPKANANGPTNESTAYDDDDAMERGRERTPASTKPATSSFFRSLSRSLSRSRRSSSEALVNGYASLSDDPQQSTHASSSSSPADQREIIIAVTSCRSDAYHENRAPGSTVKLPRRAPSALKTFHELAVAVKDAYEAGGCVPKRPEIANNNNNNSNNNNSNNNNAQKQITHEQEAKRILYDFMGNLDFLLALVDEVAIDTATRGALKEDTTFRGLRDVIKKCNRVLESMLVKRERKYTLLIRIVGMHDVKMLKKISHWNLRVEKALGGVTDEGGGDGNGGDRRRARTASDDNVSETGSEFSAISSTSSRSSVSELLRRGRDLLPSAGKVRARRATPTPRLRKRRGSANSTAVDDTAAEDGYASETLSLDNLAELQLSLDTGRAGGGGNAQPSPGVPAVIDQLKSDKKKDFSIQGMVGGQVQPMKPKDELLDVIRGLRTEQMRAREAVGTDELEGAVNPLDEIKSNFTVKAEIPSAVPKLPIEYIHRHRLMKQVVNCLLDRAGPRDTDDETPFANTITCITSRHSDKAGNGKTTLAVAAIQTVEVREFFSDGIAWINLGRTALGEREIRRLYEQLYDQLMGGEEDEDDDGGKEEEEDASNSSEDDEDGEREEGNKKAIMPAAGRGESNLSSALSENKLAKSRRCFQGGELEGMKEDLSRLLLTRRVLICLDDVCRMEDAKWFLFGTRSDGDNTFEDTPHRVLITTRIPGLVGPSITHEVFVRIFSEHEAVKLLLTAAGRRPNGLPKVSPVFAQARIIVKGCGNSPLALRIAGGMLRSRNRNWTLSSPAWKLLVDQCRTSLEEASKIRSFANSVQRLIDLSFATVPDTNFRSCLRRCFVAFAMVFHDTDSLKVGKGIARAVVIRLFAIVASMEDGRPPTHLSPEDMADLMEDATLILDTLETMNLVQRAGHGLSKSSTSNKVKDAVVNGEMNMTSSNNHRCYSMHESVKAIAEAMSKRKTEAFAPMYDEFNSFVSKSETIPEASIHPLHFDECMVVMLTGQLASMAELTQLSLYDRWNIEEYIAENMPLHLMRAKMAKRASEFLVDPDFCRRRVIALGPIESTRRHVSDLIDLRRAHTAKNTARPRMGLPSMSWLNHGESAAKCGFDIALINLNIASIKSKKGDTDGAIASYERGVQGLRKYKEDLDMAGDEAGKNKNSSHMRHLVSALGRIGSLKLKLGDKNGALEAYAALFVEVDNDSPTPSRLEKAKAHIKCATIYRQSGEREDNKHAILHLREALNMYTELFGPKHKDTVAVATSLGQWMEEEENPLR
ncbi:LOW QUALITY PROTEIN: hypothetical protein ACHAW6_008841 [Cyclotella cf. meneghiniana]